MMTNNNDNITNKAQIEHKSIKAQTQKYSIKKNQNRTHEKTKKRSLIIIFGVERHYSILH